jgi:hypothetical protein
MKALIAALCLATPAAAIECAPLEQVRAVMQAKYGERVIWFGANPMQNILIFAQPDGSTWTAFLVDGSGTACLVAAGEQWAADMPQGELN